MQLADEDKKLISEWISEKCGALKCFCCGSQRWQLLSSASIWIAFNTHSARTYFHEGVPVVHLICSNCGHILPFSASVMGLKPDALSAPRSPDPRKADETDPIR